MVVFAIMKNDGAEKAIVLVLHGESFKNIEDRHGGRGASLTQKGRDDVNIINSYLRNINTSSEYIFYYSDRQQVIQTAKIIAKNMKANLICDTRISPLYLSVLYGLSREEDEQKYSKVEGLMEKWRKGNIEIALLKIPKAESLEDFWERCFKFIGEIKKKKSTHIVVGTRSILTLLISILLNRTIELGGRYKYIEIPTGGILTFVHTANGYRICNHLSNFKVGSYHDGKL